MIPGCRSERPTHKPSHVTFGAAALGADAKSDTDRAFTLLARHGSTRWMPPRATATVVLDQEMALSKQAPESPSQIGGTKSTSELSTPSARPAATTNR